MKTGLLLFAVLLLAGIYEDVHALRLRLAPEPVQALEWASQHPQPEHKAP